MNWKRSTSWIGSVSLALFASPTFAEEVILPNTRTVALYPEDEDRDEIGELRYRGGVIIAPGEEDIGGISSLDWSDGQLHAVDDRGNWLILIPDAIQNRLTDVVEISMGPLLDARGKKPRRKGDADAEAITRMASGDWLVAYESQHRVLRHVGFSEAAQPSEIGIEPFLASIPAGDGFETLTITPDGWLACAEHSRQPNCKRRKGDEVHDQFVPAPEELAGYGAVPTDADCASNGVCYVLFRGFDPVNENHVGIVAIGPDGKSETLATWGPELTIDNFEGLAVREENARTYLYIISDNNPQLDNGQETILMKFEVSARAATTPGVAAKVFETVSVVIETTLGDIFVSLETERAPVTAANFLRYVDEDRFDGAKCYRAMRVDGGNQPSGFVQCGAQNHPDRILEGITHEPTTQTGLSHFDGALSMARFEPGTATGDFSIMIQDQMGLDANPQSDDPSLQAGFAVFGYVVDGMDTVIDIQKEPIDPDKGEGFLKGQMLAKPITIVDVRRLAAPVDAGSTPESTPE